MRRPPIKKHNDIIIIKYDKPRVIISLTLQRTRLHTSGRDGENRREKKSQKTHVYYSCPLFTNTHESLVLQVRVFIISERHIYTFIVVIRGHDVTIRARWVVVTIFLRFRWKSVFDSVAVDCVKG